MPGYDTQRFDPPAPMAMVELRTREKSLPDVPMLIDSGSDMSFLPRSSVTQLGLQSDKQRRYQVMAFDGSPGVAESVLCDLVFLGQLYRGVYLILEGDYGILGRDVLNHVSLVLEGPRLKWHEENALD